MTTSNGEPGMVDAAVGFVEHYAAWPVVTLLGGLFWRSSAHVARFKQTQEEHAEKLKEHAADIAALKAADATARVVVAGLPTKDDIRAQTEQLQHQMESGFQTMAQMIGGGRG